MVWNSRTNLKTVEASTYSLVGRSQKDDQPNDNHATRTAADDAKIRNKIDDFTVDQAAGENIEVFIEGYKIYQKEGHNIFGDRFLY